MPISMHYRKLEISRFKIALGLFIYINSIYMNAVNRILLNGGVAPGGNGALPWASIQSAGKV